MTVVKRKIVIVGVDIVGTSNLGMGLGIYSANQVGIVRDYRDLAVCQALQEVNLVRSRQLLLTLVPSLCLAIPSTGQSTSGTTGVREFPVILQQSVTAGKTPVGTKVQARLSMATLVNGTVIPRNAILSGEVIESTVKSAKEPSRVGIRMDSVTWKNGSASVKVYMTGWYYPTVVQPGQNLQYGPAQDPSRTWNGAGAYPDPNSPAYKPFPGGESEKDQAAPDTPNSITSKQRVMMKDVEIEHGSDNAILLTSRRSNIKLDRFTTYVLASGNLPK